MVDEYEEVSRWSPAIKSVQIPLWSMNTFKSLINRWHIWSSILWPMNTLLAGLLIRFRFSMVDEYWSGLCCGPLLPDSMVMNERILTMEATAYTVRFYGRWILRPKLVTIVANICSHSYGRWIQEWSRLNYIAIGFRFLYGQGILKPAIFQPPS